MIKRRKKLILWIMLGAIVLCLGVPGVLIGQQLHQDSLDHALIQAVKKLDAPAVSRLLDAGANANTTHYGEAPVTLQTLWKHLRAQLQHKTPDPTEAELPPLLFYRETLNIFRVPENSTTLDSIAVMLIHHGADIHVHDEIQQTPLHLAACNGLHKTARLLLERGADANVKSISGLTPLMYADAESARLLLEHGAEVNATVGEITPLMDAVDRGELEKVRVLLGHGADVNTTDEYGHSILYNVEQFSVTNYNRTAYLRLLKQHGARLNKKDQQDLKRDVMPSM